MCGLWGGVGKSLIAREVEMIENLGIISQTRGLDSAGIFTGHHREGSIKIGLHKSAKTLSEMLFDKKTQTLMRNLNPFLIAGHCRAATKGNITDDNAHPYLLNEIVGMHNGTVHGLPGQDPSETDSLHIYRMIERDGLEATIREIENKRGAYALVWADLPSATLNFVRNGERTLYTLRLKGVLYWASEYLFLEFIRNKLDIYSSAPIELMPMHTHFSFDMEDPLGSFRHTKVYESKFLSLFSSKEEEKEEEEETVVLGPTVKKVVMYRHTPIHHYRAFKGRHMTIGKAYRILKKGCVHCGAEAKVADKEGAYFFNSKEYVCSSCVVDRQVHELVKAKTFYPGSMQRIKAANENTVH